MEAKFQFPEPGRVVAFLPSHESKLPPVTNWRTHRKLKVHLLGFHCDNAKDLESRKKATGAESYTADIFAFRPRNKNNGDRGGRWVPGEPKDLDALSRMPDDDVIMSRIVAHKNEVFTKDGNWGQRGRCELGDCLYAVVILYAPIEMFAPGAKAVTDRARDV